MHHKWPIERAEELRDGVLHHLGPLNKSIFPQEPKFGT